MHRIPPSEQIRKQLDDLLNDGLARQENLTGTLVQLGTQRSCKSFWSGKRQSSWAVRLLRGQGAVRE